MTTLTDRYVWAVTRLLSEEQRAEIDLELRSSIGDMIEARAETRADGDGGDDEAAVLLELGDPSRLAAGYIERPRYLIGPEAFPDYLRVLKLIAVVAIPALAFLAALSASLEEDAGPGGIAAAVVSAAVTAAVHVGFWVTLVYAVLGQLKRDAPWTLDSLPDAPPPRHLTLADTVLDLGVVILAIGALFWDRGGRLTDDDGQGVPLLDPSLWDGWMYGIIGLLIAGGVIAVLAHQAGRWTARSAAANVGVNAVLLAAVGWLAADDRFLNDRFLEVMADRADLGETPHVNPWLVVLLVGAVLVWDSVDSVVRARRQAGPTGEPTGRNAAGERAAAEG